MIGIAGKILVGSSFALALGALIYYFFAAKNDRDDLLKVGNILFGLKGVLLLAASGVLVWLIFQHQFQYYYVFNYTSSDLQSKYLFSAFYGGQEGSFMLWILFSTLFGFGLMKWTRVPYKAPVLFFLTLTQLFLLSMILGFDLGAFKLGASPFRTIAEEMPNAPFLQANPDFVPENGRGLNDLLKSPWMMIHPPILFVGFSMMTIPFCFALAALWKKKYNDWVGPALPWTLASNVALLTAIFLGGYWAYVTLSFGGFWAWDPVENASLVPWLIGTAGIHTMIIQRKSSVAQKSSILFAILAYMMIVYETFLTRSGILADSSVHSFVDLGLYNQLLAFMLVITGVGLGMFFWRYKELPTPKKESKILSREFMTISGAVLLFVLGIVIILGTSSPIVGLIFYDNPTPPEISFYNDWSMPIAILMALLTVLGQYLFWRKQDAESLSNALINPLIATSVVTMLAIFLGNVRDPYYMLYYFAGFFAIIGNGWVMVSILRKQPKLFGGTITHIGFGSLLIGALASSVFVTPLIDQQTEAYNETIKRGEAFDEQGFQITQPVSMLVLKLDQPKIVGEYIATYEGYTIQNQNRPGQQTYAIKFEPLNGGQPFYLNPEVYPMMSTSTQENIQWSVDPDVRSGIMSDIYLYVAGSAFVEQQNMKLEKNNGSPFQPASMNGEDQGTEQPDSMATRTLIFTRGQSSQLGSFKFRFVNYAKADSAELPSGTILGVRAEIEVTNPGSGQVDTIEPLFAVYSQDGNSYTYTPPVTVPSYDFDVQFTRINPETDTIELTIAGLGEEFEEEWVTIVAEKKPFISVVWLGTFFMMIGFSVSILRHWEREKSKNS